MRDYVEWLNGRGLEPSSRGVIFDYVVTIMGVAVVEHTIPENPFRSRLIKRARGVRRKIVRFRAVAGLAGDVAAPVFGEYERQIQDQAAFGVFAGGDAVQDLHGYALLEQIIEDDQALEEVTARRSASCTVSMSPGRMSKSAGSHS